MDIKTSLIEARSQYIAEMRAELLGPGSEYNIPDEQHELITSLPEERYSIGVLFPQETPMASDASDSLDPLSDLTEDTEQPLEDETVTSETPSASRKEYRTEDEADDTTDSNLEDEVSLSTQNRPSSMGITFVVDGDTQQVHGTVSFATYRSALLKDCKLRYSVPNPSTYTLPTSLTPYMQYNASSECIELIAAIKPKVIYNLKESKAFPEDELLELYDASLRLSNQLQSGHVRIPHSVDFILDFSEKDYIDQNQNIDGVSAKITALRKKTSHGLWSITVMLVNTERGKSDGRNCLLQPQLTFSSQNNSFLFSEYSTTPETDNLTEEEQSIQLLYRNQKIYGSGLGTSIDWDIENDGQGRVYSNFFPIAEIAPMDFSLPANETVSQEHLSMKYLSDLNTIDKAVKLESLRNIANLYCAWIQSLNESATTLPAWFRAAAEKNINQCEKVCQRIYDGIDLLENNPLAWDAFLLANRAMFMQREQLQLQKATSNIDRYKNDAELSARLNDTNFKTAEDKHFWRPFQLAFLLMDIKSIVDETCEDRNLVDLIWFPTGGGKTEAYLGLTAFTIFYRKLQFPKNSNGTAVMMRYTLRLLTAQQFTRAATLICACEFIRRYSQFARPPLLYKKYPLGTDEITIGLWIGGDHTPNKNAKAKDLLAKLNRSTANSLKTDKEKYNKFQVLKCPWCGTKLVKERSGNTLVGDWGYHLSHNSSFYMSCPQEDCEFNAKLPIQIVDEELYKSPTSLLFGTVDKFAMLPWESQIGNFFAIHDDNRTPELIIQDELHLISGPLGTMVGLYETAIDALCQEKGGTTKIIASTATICRAKEQCAALYNRDMIQFPPPGLTADDSFFAREQKIDHDKKVFGRIYVGLMPSGKTKAMMEARSIAALLQLVQSLKIPDPVKDKFWTLAVYCNSLKDLGKCATLVDDDVKDFINRTSKRRGTFHSRRFIYGCDELTSRVKTTDLNETLDKLEKREYSAENLANKRYASDVVLATNMISVGIDIARLNNMLLVGQPKLTSEYIQASSRVGREYPGTAFILYDASKSRDRSHFEQFKAYHGAFYKFVEPTSATPFSKPARDRALHAVAATILRHKASLGTDADARYFDTNAHQALIQDVQNFILKRSQEVSYRMNSSQTDDSAQIKDELALFFEFWQEIIDNSETKEIFFGKKFMMLAPSEGQSRLFKAFGSNMNDTIAKDTLTSMRNVDTAVASSILIWEES